MSSRPTAVTVAAVLLALLSVLSLLSSLILGTPEGVPAFATFGDVVLGAAGLFAAYGIWSLRRWGFWLAIVVLAIDILLAAPGVAFAPTAVLRTGAIVSVVLYAIIIVLVVLPTSRRAFVASS